jgi:hypothetical protein
VRACALTCNFAAVDDRYEDDDHDIASFFAHQHPDYAAPTRSITTPQHGCGKDPH